MENLLPENIKLDILSRLPTESVFECKRVCKTWRTMLNHLNFADMHLSRSRQSNKFGILYLHGEYDGNEKQLFYGEYVENDYKSHERLTRINHPAVSMRDKLVGSCNGLICFSVNDEYNINDSVYICNPITREYVYLPRYNNDLGVAIYITQPMVYGFGYIPSTNEYKVVRIIYWRDSSGNTESVGSVQVYTLGSGSGWRNKGQTMFSLLGDCFHSNGALYWMDGKMKIAAFDLADEQFHVIPLPPFEIEYDDKILLRVLGGLLCIVHRKTDISLDIWSAKKITSTNYMTQQQNHSWSWHKDFAISYDEVLLMHNYDPFAYTKSGGVLMWYDYSRKFPDNHNHFILFTYDPQTEDLDQFATDFLFLEAIPHWNSFVSLKSLGEDAKFLGSAEESFERPPSRPMKRRKRDKDESHEAQGEGGEKKRRRCNACGGVGHNRRTCNGGVPNSSKLEEEVSERQ